MWTRARNLWHPENFHYSHRLGRGGGFFEGWYFKLVDRDGAHPHAIIPGVFLGADSHAFVQVLDGTAGSAAYHRFPIEEFEAARDHFEMRIARNRFTREKIALDIPAETSSAKQGLHGEIRVGPWREWPSNWLSPGIMGPYSFVPFMECNHGILSLDHSLEGALEVEGRSLSFAGGRGYIEKDWGRSFPSGYVWAHSNHFVRPGICLTASVARIPWLTGAFRGFIIGFLVDGELHRFTTYNGGKVEELQISDTHVAMRVRNRRHRLEIEATKSEGAILHAPYEQQMLERVSETMSSVVDVRLTALDTHEELFSGRGQNSCLEAQGDLAAVLDE